MDLCGRPYVLKLWRSGQYPDPPGILKCDNDSLRGGVRIWTVTSIQTIHSSFSQVPHPMVSPLLEICLQTPSDSHSLSPSEAITGAVKGQSHSPFFVPDLHSEMWIKRLSGGEAWKRKCHKRLYVGGAGTLSQIVMLPHQTPSIRNPPYLTSQLPYLISRSLPRKVHPLSSHCGH